MYSYYKLLALYMTIYTDKNFADCLPRNPGKSKADKFFTLSHDSGK